MFCTCKQLIIRSFLAISIQTILILSLQAQNRRAALQIGTQFPLQYGVGVEYQFNKRISSYLQAGLLTKPYDEYLIHSMELSGLKKDLSRIMRRSFDRGLFLNLGTNYHFDKYYAGVFGQIGNMHGKGPLLEMANIYFKGKLPEVDPTWLILAENLQMNWRSKVIDAGLIVGRRFLFSDSRFELRTEFGLTKILASNSKFTVGNSLIDDTPLAQEFYTKLKKEFKDAYWKYGLLPSLNLYLVYKLN